VGQRRDQRLALRRARGDRRALDREGAALEVDVVQLLAVDEPAGGDVADLRVVLPAVPEPADHLDPVGGLVERVAQHLLHGRVVAVDAGQLGELAPAEQPGLVLGQRHPHLHAGAPAAHEVEGGDRLGQVERLGVGDQGGRHQADVPGERRDAGGDEDGVEPAAHPVGAVVGPEPVVGLQREGVLEGDQVEQAGLGLADQVGPVPGGEQLRRAGVRLAPGSGVPAGAVQGDGQVQVAGVQGVRHGRTPPAARTGSARRPPRPRAAGSPRAAVDRWPGRCRRTAGWSPG
jgi:hypothetical protein